MSSSSLLGVSNDASSKSEEFSLKDIEAFVDQNWFKRAHVYRSTAKLADKDQKSQTFLKAESGVS